MKILPISFNNKFISNKITSCHAQPLTLKVDTVEFSKNISFSANIKTEEEILEVDKKVRAKAQETLNEVPKIIKEAQEDVKQARNIWQKIISNNESDNSASVIQTKNSIIYREYISSNQYDEWEFGLNGRIKSISRGVKIDGDITKILSKKYFINDDLDELQLDICEEKGRSLKIKAEYSFMNERLLTYYKGVTESQKNITHIKEKFYFDKNNSLHSYIEEELSGENWITTAQEIIYTDGKIAQYQKDKLCENGSTHRSQISWFKDGKLYNTRIKG